MTKVFVEMEEVMSSYRQKLDYNENKTLISEIKDYISNRGFSGFNVLSEPFESVGVREKDT